MTRKKPETTEKQGIERMAEKGDIIKLMKQYQFHNLDFYEENIGRMRLGTSQNKDETTYEIKTTEFRAYIKKTPGELTAYLVKGNLQTYESTRLADRAGQK